MNDPQTTKMLQAILSGQTAVKQELISRIDKVEKRLEEKIDNVDQNLSQVEKRLDKIGMQLAYLEDDTPTREECFHPSYS